MVVRLEHGKFPEGAKDALTPGAVREYTGDDTYGRRTIPEGFKRSWTAPCCERCWVERRGFQQPVMAVRSTRGARVCAFCGRPTWVGIFTRVDPADVPYPELEEVGA